MAPLSDGLHPSSSDRSSDSSLSALHLQILVAQLANMVEVRLAAGRSIFPSQDPVYSLEDLLLRWGGKSRNNGGYERILDGEPSRAGGHPDA